ncbi:hypothetical protein GCM10028773_43870 [Spirosoma koreense]
MLQSVGLPAQPSDVSFEQFTTDHGLSNDLVTAMLKDRRGFMWFGTVNGLNRFDGLQFTVFRRTGRPDGLPGNYIVNDGIAQDRDGFLWVSTNRGLCRYDPQTNRFRNLALPEQRDQLADNDFVSPVRFDSDGNGWFASIAQLYRLEPRTGRLTAFPLPLIRLNSYATPMPDRRGRLWVHHGGAIYRFDPATRRYTYQFGEASAHASVEFMVEGPQGQLYVLTNHSGVYRYDGATDRFLKLLTGPAGLTALAEDRLPDGRPFYWLSSPNRLMTYGPPAGRKTEFTPMASDPLSFPGGTVGLIQTDAQTGIVWMGTTKGVVKVDPVALKFGRKWLRTTPSETAEQVETIRQDDRHDSWYWVLSRNSLYRWDRQTGVVQAIRNDPSLSDPDYHCLTQDEQGRLWIGRTGGLAIYDPQTRRWQIRRDVGSADRRNNVSLLALCRGLDGRIWLGTAFDGLHWYDPTTNRIQRWHGLPPELFANGISRLQTDPFGQIWAQTRAGLFRVNPYTQQTRRIRVHGSVVPVQPSDRLHSTFFVTDRGQLWVAGIDFLVRADTSGRVDQTYTLANGLLADHVFGIAEDRRGHLWLTSDNQLHELDPQTGRFRYYNRANGLFGNTLFGQISVDRQGQLFTGYLDAFNYWKPERLRQNTVPPPVVITQIRVNNQPRLVGSSIRLEPGESTLAVDFAALTFSQPEKNRYAYRLVGFDPDWVPTDDPTATYTNLEPGTYTLRVKAANNDGVWNETGASLAIRVVPPYWKTDWFRLLVGLVSVGLLYGLYQYRERQRQRLERIRDRIATDLHDDMGSTLSSIRIFSDVVQQQIAPTTPDAVPILQRISSSATALSESMQDIIWTIQTKNDRLDDVVARMREFGLKMAEAKGIVFHMQVSEQFEKTRLNVEQRRNLYLIVKESINNAVKYAQASRIDVCLTIETGRQLHLRISDNGRGFDPGSVQPGNGLPNLHKRAREIRGNLTLTSAPGAGTQINLLTKL